jgi:hypothetical protein
MKTAPVIVYLWTQAKSSRVSVISDSFEILYVYAD